MFGFGGKDKDKLKENMGEIKQLINEGKDSVQEDQQGLESELKDNNFDSTNEEADSFDDGGFDSESNLESEGENPEKGTSGEFESFSDSPQADEPVESFDQFDESPQDTKSDTSSQPAQSNTGQNTLTDTTQQEPATDQDQDQPRAQPQSQPSQRQSLSDQVREASQEVRDRKDREVQEQRAGRQTPKDQRPQSRDAARSDSQASGKTRDERVDSLDSSIPEPAKTRDLNIPEIEKGPLFIRRQKFERAHRMVEEMRYISSEIEDVVNQLEGGIKEDKSIERNALELMDEFEGNREEVENIISPGKE